MQNTSENSSNENTQKAEKKAIMDSVREIIIDQSTKGIKLKDIYGNLSLARQSVSSIIKIFNETGRVYAKKRGGGNNKKLNAEHENFIKEEIDNNPTITLKELKNKLLEKHRINVSISTIGRRIGDFHYSLKSLTVIPERRNNPRTIEVRFEYGTDFNNMLLNIENTNFFFIDEVGFCVSSRAKRGRSLVGQPAYQNVCSIRTRNISVIACMNLQGMVFKKINPGAVNGENFITFFRELLDECDNRDIIDPIFILDDARIHHYSGFKEFVLERDVKIKYLPPYSPFLNPIENVFSKWKNFVIRGNASNESELNLLIDGGFNSINSSDTTGYFRKMLRYISRCINREEILD